MMALLLPSGLAPVANTTSHPSLLNLSSLKPTNYPSQHQCRATSTTTRDANHPFQYITNLNQQANASDAKQIHAQFLKSGHLFESANTLAILYSNNFSSLDDARKLFDKIPHRTLPAYAALIRSYCRSQRWEDLLSVVGLMIHEGFQPNKYLLPTILKACSALELLNFGRMFHGYILRNQLEIDVFVGNALIDMYSNCGDLGSSTIVFDVMPERDVVSWTALVSAYMDAGFSDEARVVFESMKLNGVKPDLISWNAMVSGFARNGEIDEALNFLEAMQETGLKPAVDSWNGIISGCVQNGYFEEAIAVLRQMLWSFVNPNAVTLACILPACGALQDLNLGKEIHACAFKRKIIWSNIFVGGSLIDMYSKCGRRDIAERAFLEIKTKNTTVWNEMITAYVNERDMMAASELFHRMQSDGLKPDIVTYNTMLAGYARKGEKEEAFGLFLQMTRMGLRPSIVSMNVLISGFQKSGLNDEALKLFKSMQSSSSIINNSTDGRLLNVSMQPNSVTLTSALSACADLKSLHRGKEIHGYIRRNGYEHNMYVSCALVDMYAKCHDMNSATKVFYGINDKTMVAWNILVAGHANNAEPEDAMKLFSQMLEDGLEPNSVTLKILLSACTNIAAHMLGQELHGYIVKVGLDESLSTSMEDMYAECGSLV